MAADSSSGTGEDDPAATGSFAFGPFRFDPISGFLYRGDEETLLPPRVSAVLEMLARRPGEVILKDELLGEVWKDAFVAEDSLTQAISVLRNAMGDDSRRPTWIQTVPKRGYRFIGAVESAVEPGRLEIVRGVADYRPSAGPAESGVAARLAAGPGDRLGHYELLDELGSGAMGVVYRARDRVLEREVAIKLLPAAVLSDPERLGRLEREAKLLASVSHPNIASIHSLEDEDGVKFPVLELVEGETLAERLARGPMPVVEALEIGWQVASAIEAAHNRGILHRDLKPANVKIGPKGQAKVLDFGLAKALEVEVFEGASGGSATESMTIRGARRGSIVGTAAYMSPEQARGQEVDRRSDIWSFGCVLYEMLTAKRAFGGETISGTIARVLEREPDRDALPQGLPRGADWVLRRCLEKDPDQRLHDIADARIEIEEALRPIPEGGPVPRLEAEIPSKARWILPWAVAAAAVAFAVGVVLWPQRGTVPRTTPFPVYRYTIALPLEEKLPEALVARNILAISPDGSTIAYSAFDNSVEGYASTRLYVRRLDEVQADARVLAESGGGAAPFFSPDGRWIGFRQGRKLMKVGVGGGAPIEICEARGGGGGGSWAADDSIVFTHDRGIARVAAAGGEPEVIAAPDPEAGEVRYAWPKHLPGDRAVVYSIETSDIQTMEDARIAVMDLESGTRHLLDVRGSAPTYSPSGHLLYVRDGAIHAVAFNVDSYTSSGPSFVVQDGLLSVYTGTPTYSLAADGTLIYVPGPRWSRAEPVWVDRDGEITPMAEEPLGPWYMNLSPDGRRVALDVGELHPDILIYDMERGPRIGIRRDWDQVFEVWMPDGEEFLFSESVAGRKSFFRQDLRGGEPEPLPIESGEYLDFTLTSVSPDSRWLILDALHPETGWDLLLMSLEGEGGLQELLVTAANEERPVFSPDGRMIAYVSDANGQAEIYVMRASQRGAAGRSVSEVYAGAYRWGPDSNALYYAQRASRGYLDWYITERPVRSDPELTLGEPRVAFRNFDDRFNYWSAYHWDLGRDGRLLLKMDDEPWDLPNRIDVVLHWSEELKRLVPTDR